MKHLVFKACRKIFRENPYTDQFIMYKGQKANDYIAERIKNEKSGLMISKFGTIELDNIICYEINKNGISIQDYVNAIRGRYSIHKQEAFVKLCNNAGFFPNNEEMLENYDKLVREDIKEIDILGSYLKAEKYINSDLTSKCVKVDLDGYYAPFLWKNPWTRCLKGKRVLVIHPFVDSIKKQYEKREKLFANPDVLPEFSNLYLIKAVQSIANNDKDLPYKDWFDALKNMENQMDKIDYDIALIGCGAYGMNLAAHAKRNGKIAIHLAGWTQMLFGIYGNRWIEDQPEYHRFVNEYWIRPSEKERPYNVDKVENACYW